MSMLNKILLSFAAALSLAVTMSAQTLDLPAQNSPAPVPSATLNFAVKGADTLYLDIYRPAPGVCPECPDVRPDAARPTILFMFGGGFKEGDRVAGTARWINSLMAHGYTVVSIDYRLGMKDYKGAGLNMKFVRALINSITIAVEDLYSATLFLLENGAEYGVDARNMVVCGSSAGAISVLQGEYAICNGDELAKVLPEGFNYAGVMSLSGAVYSNKGKPKYAVEPCPMALFHGTDDSIVPYWKKGVLNYCLAGSSMIADALSKKDYRYHIYRFKGRNHEVSIYQDYCLDLELDFLENDVRLGNRRRVDALIDDPLAPDPGWNLGDFKNLY